MGVCPIRLHPLVGSQTKEIMRLTKKQNALLSRTAGRRYRIAKLEGRRDPSSDWRERELRGNQLLPRSFVTFGKEEKKNYAVLMVHYTINFAKCDCESWATAETVEHNEDYSEIVLTGPYGRLTYSEIK